VPFQSTRENAPASCARAAADIAATKPAGKSVLRTIQKFPPEQARAFLRNVFRIRRAGTRTPPSADRETSEKRLTSTHHDIARALAFWRGDTITHQAVATWVGCSVRSVQRALKLFLSLGLVSWRARFVACRHWVARVANEYFLGTRRKKGTKESVVIPCSDNSAPPSGLRNKTPPLLEAIEARQTLAQLAGERAALVARRWVERRLPKPA